MSSSRNQRKFRRLVASLILAAFLVVPAVLNPSFAGWLESLFAEPVSEPEAAYKDTQNQASSLLARDVLESLAVKDKDESRDYNRKLFYSSWSRNNQGCTMREAILDRDLTEVKKKDECKVETGKLADPYTGKEIDFQRGQSTSSAVQIDHVVALSNAWSTGAADFDENKRHEISQDPLNLIAVDGPANQEKSDQDAADWLPENESFQCQYVARQISVKYKYGLWVTPEEKAAMLKTLQACPDEEVVGIELK